MKGRKNTIEVLRDGTRAARTRLGQLAGRQAGMGRIEPDVRRILDTVRRSGDKAVLRYTKRFDGVQLRARDLIVRDSEIERAAAQVPADTARALRDAHRRIVKFHRAQCEKGFDMREPGIRTGMRVTPLEQVGVYVPGGRAAYPSSVLMNIVPAKVARVPDITVVTPPSPDGIRPEVLLAAKIAGATRVVRVGGAQAIGALAYGTESIRRVDKIVGPGNAWVATAKRLVFGQVDIDMIAGPTEVLIVADSSATPEFVAADMLAQAEHDPESAAVCLATSLRTAEAVAAQIEEQLQGLSRRAIAGRSIRRWGTIVVVDSAERAAEISNEIAPEHLELFIRNARKASHRFKHAGAIFLGQHTTESLGDYAAGPNHVLPTGGSARFSSPLGVYDFVKRTSIIEASAAGLARLAPTVERMARSEGLEGHALAVTRRTRKGGS
jgi:histidinol dehydrogenase